MKTLLATGIVLMMAGLTARAQQPQQPNLQDALQNLMQGMQGNAANSPAVEVVNFRELKALLPEELEGMERISFSGEKSGGFGMVVAFAEAAYRNEEGGTVNVKVTDMGAMKGFAALAQVGWANAEIDREDENGFERTTTIQGHKAMEKYNATYQTGEVSLWANTRLMFEIRGRQVAFEAIRGGADALPVDEFLALLEPAEAEEEEAEGDADAEATPAE